MPLILLVIHGQTGGINLAEAEDKIKKALAKKPDDGYIRDSLGWVYFRKGDYKAALAELLRAFQMLSDDPTIAEHIGDVYTALQQQDKAIDYFKKSLSLEKKDDKKKQLEQKIKSLEEKGK